MEKVREGGLFYMTPMKIHVSKRKKKERHVYDGLYSPYPMRI